MQLQYGISEKNSETSVYTLTSQKLGLRYSQELKKNN